MSLTDSKAVRAGARASSRSDRPAPTWLPLLALLPGFCTPLRGIDGSAHLASVAPAPAGPSARPADARVSRVQSRLHQLRSTQNHPFSLFEYAVPTPNAVPHILAIDHHDGVWFSESGGRFAQNFIDVPPMNKIGRLDQGGTVSEWTLGPEASSPMGVVFDRQGDLWVAERLANRITRRRASGQVDQHVLPTPNAWPTGIAVDSKGNIWATETMGNQIVRLDPETGKLTEFALPVAKARPTGIAVGGNDQVWVAMRDAGALASFDPRTETFKQIKLPTANSKPCGVMVDPGGRVWFSERNGGKLGAVQPDGTVVEFYTGSAHGGPFLMVADRTGNVWFSELFGNRIGRFDPIRRMFEFFPLPTKNAYPAGLAVDSKGNVWFAQQGANLIGVIVRTDLAYLQGGQSKPDGRRGLENARHEIVELDVPSPQAFPGIVAVDRRGTVWFTEMGGGWVSPGFPPGPPGSRVGFVKDGKIHELKTPTGQSGPTSMAVDPCSDDIWISLRAANKVARIRDQEITEFDIPAPASLPIGIAVDRDHNVWVALSDANKIGRMTPQGRWRLLDLPTGHDEPRTVFVDSADEVWFAAKSGNRIGIVDKKAWTVRSWELPTRLGWPLSLIEDGKRNIWFAEMRSDRLGMFDRTTEAITEYPLPVQSAPFKISFDKSSNALWISTVFHNAILRFDLDRRQVVSAYAIPSEGAWMGGLDRDQEGCFWFSEQFANKLGRLCVEGVSKRSLGPAASPAAVLGAAR
jgi:virginiamycin B lyase